MAREHKIAMTIHFPVDLVAELKAEQLGDSFSTVVTDRVNQALKMGKRESAPPSAREQKDALQVEKLAREEALAKREVLTREQVMAFYVPEMQIVRSRVDAIAQRVFGLSAEQTEQLRDAIEECYRHIRGDRKETWDDIGEFK